VEDQRSRISAAAQEVFLREWIEGVSMRKVAEKVGVTAPAIYRHFRDKGELLNEIIVAGLANLENYLRPAFDADKPYERLRRLTEGYLDFALEQPKYFDFAFLVPSRNIGRFSEELARHDWKTFRFALEQVSSCMEQGEFRPDDPLETAIMIWAEVHGLVILFKTERFGRDVEQFRRIYRRTVDRLLEGLKS
jgi:AcrR family transcriptional regulator